MNDITPLTVSRRSSLEERQLALMQIYRQVLERQPYQSERQTIASLEKDFVERQNWCAPIPETVCL